MNMEEKWSPLVVAFVDGCRQRGLTDATIVKQASVACRAFPELQDEFQKAGLVGEAVDAVHGVTSSLPFQIASIGAGIAAPHLAGGLALASKALPLISGSVSAAKQLKEGRPIAAAGEAASTAMPFVGPKVLPNLYDPKPTRQNPRVMASLGQAGLQMAPQMLGHMGQDAWSSKAAAATPAPAPYPGMEDMLSAFNSTPDVSPVMGNTLHHMGQRIGENGGILRQVGIGAGVGAAAGKLLDNPSAGAGAGAGFSLGRAAGDVGGSALGTLVASALGARMGLSGEALQKFMRTGSEWGHRGGGITGGVLGGLGGYHAVRSAQHDNQPSYKFGAAWPTREELDESVRQQYARHGLVADEQTLATAWQREVAQRMAEQQASAQDAAWAASEAQAGQAGSPETGPHSVSALLSQGKDKLQRYQTMSADTHLKYAPHAALGGAALGGLVGAVRPGGTVLHDAAVGAGTLGGAQLGVSTASRLAGNITDPRLRAAALIAGGLGGGTLGGVGGHLGGGLLEGLSGHSQTKEAVDPLPLPAAPAAAAAPLAGIGSVFKRKANQIAGAGILATGALGAAGIFGPRLMAKREQHFGGINRRERQMNKDEGFLDKQRAMELERDKALSFRLNNPYLSGDKTELGNVPM